MLTLQHSQGEVHDFKPMKEEDILLEDELLQEGEEYPNEAEFYQSSLSQPLPNVPNLLANSQATLEVAEQSTTESSNIPARINGAEKRFRESIEEIPISITNKKQKLLDNLENTEELDVLAEEEEEEAVSVGFSETGSSAQGSTTEGEVSLGLAPGVDTVGENLDLEAEDEEDLSVEDTLKEVPSVVPSLIVPREDEIEISEALPNNYSESDKTETITYNKDNVDWSILSSEFLLIIFSSSILDFQDLYHCILVCKQWKQKCDVELFWKSMQTRLLWHYGSVWVQVSRFVDSGYNWKAIAKQRQLLIEQCSLQEISRSIERKYAEMEKIIAERA